MSSQYISNSDSQQAKADLRVKMRALRQRLCAHDRQAQSILIADRLGDLFEKLSPRKVGLYLATNYEVNLDALIEQLYKQQIEVYLPHLEDSLTPFHQFQGWGNLKKGPLDLRHPPSESPSLEAASLDVILLPGLAFDRQGNRLGHGGGWYDRVLDFKINPESKPILIGVGFEQQLEESVPCEAFDVRMDIVVTPSLVVRI